MYGYFKFSLFYLRQYCFFEHILNLLFCCYTPFLFIHCSGFVFFVIFLPFGFVTILFSGASAKFLSY